MARNYGLPYQGSKRAIAKNIIDFIIKRHPDIENFYDLFGGGGAISFCVLENYPKMNVFYNELNPAIFGLVEHIKKGGDLPTDWVSREDFEKNKDRQDWYGGFIKTVWSFSNSGKNYLYGKEIEGLKKLAHDLVANKIVSEKLEIPLVIQRKIANLKTINSRRLAIRKYFKGSSKISDKFRTIHFERLEYLESAQRLQHLQNLQHLQLLNQEYQNCSIKNTKTVVYCDPPYEDTAGYHGETFDSQAFYDWAWDCPLPVYFSSYEISDKRFKLVKAIRKVALMGGAKTNNKSNFECLYWNGKS